MLTIRSFAAAQTGGSALPRATAPAPNAQRASDPAYRTAYRDCMKARVERGR